MQKISGFIGNIHSGALGLTSTLALVFVAIGLLRTIEATFNDIWGVPRGRGWLTSIVQYWAAITLGPIVLVLAVGLTSGPYYQKMAEWIGSRGALGSVVFAALPFVVLSLGFALLYQLMPHTKVRWPAALAGGIVGGCLWQLNNKLSVTYVASAVSYSKIYGSLGLLPLFLAGLYFSWLILLFGAQVAYAYQNRRTYLQEKQSGNVHQLGREFVALRLMTRLAGDFQRGEKPSGTNELGAALAVPTRLVSQILQTLLHARLVVEVSGRDTAYAPARPLDQITLHEIGRAHV